MIANRAIMPMLIGISRQAAFYASALGKGEVLSSILSGSTTRNTNEIAGYRAIHGGYNQVPLALRCAWTCHERKVIAWGRNGDGANAT